MSNKIRESIAGIISPFSIALSVILVMVAIAIITLGFGD